MPAMAQNSVVFQHGQALQPVMQAVPHHSAFQYHPPQQQPRSPPPQLSPQLPPPPQPLVQVPQQGSTPPEATTTIRNDNNDKSQRRETFSCRNASRWSLPPPNGDKSKNHAAAEAVDIFEVSNVLVLPSAHFNEVVFSAANGSDTRVTDPHHFHDLVVGCVGTHQDRHKRAAERKSFFNCPCAFDPVHYAALIKKDENRYCPASGSWSVPPVNGTEVAFHDKDLLVVFNSWSMSMYHVFIDTIFPLFATVDTLAAHGHATDRLTLMNLSPDCSTDRHLSAVKPAIDALFGKGVYEIASGNVSNSFSSTSAAHYAHVAVGFAYPWRPFRHNPHLAYDPHIGRLFRRFCDVFTDKLLGTTSTAPSSSTALEVVSNQTDGVGAVVIIKRQADNERNINCEALQRALRSHGMEATVAQYGAPPLHALHDQAKLSRGVRILIGAEGAGFVQQIFMRPGGLLVLFHCPRRESNGNVPTEGPKIDWHAAVAQYIGHHVLDIVTTRCDQFQDVDFTTIADAVQQMVAHTRAAKDQLTGTIHLNEWRLRKNNVLNVKRLTN